MTGMFIKIKLFTCTSKHFSSGDKNAMVQKKKKILQLNEGTVRDFMKFANIGHLSDKFIKESYSAEDEMDEVKTKDQSRAGGAPDRLDEMPEDPSAEGGESAPPPAPEVPAEPEGGGAEGDIQALVSAIANAIQDQTGVAISVSGGETGGEAMPPPEGGDLGAGMEGGGVPGGEEEMFEQLAQKLGYVKNEDGSFAKANPTLAESKVKEEKLEEEEELEEGKEELDEDAAQEKKQGQPKPGSHEKVKGAESPKKISSDDPKAKPVKEKQLPKDMGNEPLSEELAKKVYASVLKKLAEDLKKTKEKKNLPELTKEEQEAALLEARKAKAQKK